MIDTIFTNCKQKTIDATIMLNGIGLHSGARVSMKMMPAKEDNGIKFIRTDIYNKNLTM